MNENNYIFRECEVLSVNDDQGGLRIKVRIDPEDNMLPIERIPFCFPLLPKHFHINPKVGEMVLVITSKINSLGKRWFIGPIVSQQYGLYNEPFLTAKSIIENGTVTQPLPRPDLNPDNEGSYPNREDIAIQGRNNADLILKENELRLRCGFKKNRYGVYKDNLVFNKEDLAYIQMKYKLHTDKNNNAFYSTINVVADRINLLSHDSRTPFNLNDSKELISDDELERIIEKAHPLPYGDELINFLKELVEIIRTHVHPFPKDPPDLTQPQINTLSKPLENMLSNSIRIN